MGKENATVNVLVSGCEGKMGRLIVDLVNKHLGWRVCCGYDKYSNLEGSYPVFGPMSDVDWYSFNPNIMIDFSKADVTPKMYQLAKQLGIPFLTGTTKLPENLIQDMQSQTEIPVFQAYNMSLEVFQFIQDECLEAKKLAEQGYDIDIIEAHAPTKQDAPSGTAMDLARALCKTLGDGYEIVIGCPSRPRAPKEIRITSLRQKHTAGTHIIQFSNEEECIERKHEASSRSVFAEGAIKAAEFLLEQSPDYYNMSSIYGGFND